MDGADVLAAAEQCRALLEPRVSDDWSAPVPGLEHTVSSVVAHIAATMVWYSIDIWNAPDLTVDGVKVEENPGAPNATLLASVTGGARTLAATLDSASPQQRGFHPFGSPDPTGFAAMGCDELLVHGDDAARGLGVTFAPDPALAAAVLARLYPQHEVGDDPWRTLLWANGRIDLGGRDRQTRWRWHSAPLESTC